MSEDEIPSDVNLNDPYFAEELGKTGEFGKTGNFGNKRALSLHNETKEG